MHEVNLILLKILTFCDRSKIYFGPVGCSLNCLSVSTPKKSPEVLHYVVGMFIIMIVIWSQIMLSVLQGLVERCGTGFQTAGVRSGPLSVFDCPVRCVTLGVQP